MSNCSLILKPFMDGRIFTHMEVRLSFDGLRRDKGEEMFRMARSTASIPGCAPESLRIIDALGELSFSAHDESEYPYEYRVYKASRALSGSVSVNYTVTPRPYRQGDACGPYFDLRAEDGGANVAGLSILPVIPDCEGQILLQWDCSAMPAGAYGVNTFGEGDISYTGKLEKLRQSYFAWGLLHSITQRDFGFYWLTEPDFDVSAIAEYVRKLYSVMAPFFHDKQSVYRVFVRKDPPYPGSGGTALLRSYMFGWNKNEPVSVAEKQNILAHEMVHNWTNLNDMPYGTTSWYSEGTAEYYSIILPLRAGLIDRETALYEVQRRTDAYFTNPTRHLDNMEAARQSWIDRRTQKIPYGRGIFFLANCDVKIRQATAGRCGIDDVVCALLKYNHDEMVPGNERFLAAVKDVSGLDLTEDWEIMRSGGHFAPLPESFDGLLTLKEVPAIEANTGKTVVSYRWTLK